MILDTKEKLEIAMPLLRSSQDDTFIALEPFITSALDKFKSELFGSCYAFLESEDEKYSYIQRKASILVGYQALHEAIPELDLRLTPNGFGVVSTEGIVPASGERVRRLIENCQYKVGSAFMAIRDVLYNQFYDDWKVDMSVVLRNIQSLVFLNSHVSPPQYEQEDYLYRNAVHFLRIRSLVERFVSRELYAELLLKLQTKTAEDPLTSTIIAKIQEAMSVNVSSALQDPTHISEMGTRLFKSLSQFLEDNANDYPVYLNSQLHKSYITPCYENKQKQRSFFF